MTFVQCNDRAIVSKTDSRAYSFARADGRRMLLVGAAVTHFRAGGARKANGADPKVDPTLTSAWFPLGTLGGQCFTTTEAAVDAPALAPASGSVARLVPAFVRTEALSNAIPVPGGGSETGPSVMALSPRTAALSGRSLRAPPRRQDRKVRSMAILLRVPVWRPPCVRPKPYAGRSRGPRGQFRHLNPV